MRQPRFPIFTIGHSSHALETFVEMLRAAGVGMIIDVRSFPRSRTNPQFNTETLPPELAPDQIAYEHLPDLGGRRKAQGTVPSGMNGLWHNRSFQNYADYALTEQFQVALDRVVGMACHHRLALMCSEAVWWRCHRRIITDYLIAREIEVLHIMSVSKTSAARLTQGAVIGSDKMVRYPQPDQ
ncbi:hypothetical protein GCM10007989_31920 [Devosia pacifica]|uniref:DNA repair protein n=1 Tax=Devosia pacifica TaxID=1335967 RepID=A0A918VX48_9HYPH|nr:DUF488 domain-containing protein [Devosia pacifica]GHA33322.1 hypothetical protein GCM10007989_31920 [Devosia pacifica]